MRAVGGIIGGAVLVVTSCLEPTELIVEIRTSARCTDIVDTSIVVASKGAVAKTPPVATTPGCKSDGRIGSIVILRGADMPSILEVTTGFSRSSEDCRKNPGLGCVVSRREIRFVPHSALNLEIHQDVDCNGVPCDTEVSTCMHGKCVDLTGDGGSMGGTCPSGRGAAMVVVAGYCIDSTEATNAQYAAFLATQPAVTGLPSRCSFKKDFTPEAAYATTDPDNPQTGVDWCDSHTFCAWAGKRLCGLRPGATAPPRIDVVDKAHDEWYLACAGAALRAFPYGDTYDPTRCASVEKGLMGSSHVASLSTCEGGYPGVFDLGGNAQEWLETCAGTTMSDKCMHGQPSWFWNKGDPINSSRCDGGGTTDSDYPAFRFIDSGFRCCADLL